VRRAAQLTGVACPSTDDCWTVGSYSPLGGTGDQALTEHWDGSSWTVVTAPDPLAGGDDLNGVACISSSECWAVGGQNDGAGGPTLTERWDGTTWTAVPSPSDRAGALYSVTCVSTADCWAVGGVSRAFGIGVVGGTLVEHWNGASWSIVNAPSQIPTSSNGQQYRAENLDAVTCVAASDCWAVGYAETGNSADSLVEHWDGRTWNLVSTPNPVGYNWLADVACVSSTDCWIAGGQGAGSTGNYNSFQDGYFLHWDGTAWRVVATPMPNGSHEQPISVRCLSGNECWSVGTRISASGGAPSPIAFLWNGQSWSGQPIPVPPVPTPPPDYRGGVNTSAQIIAISCPAPTMCTAVGSSAAPVFGDRTPLVEMLS
jgi:hypothetical protein